MVLNHLSNTYIIPCDIWCDKNPYHHHELYSWYMVSDLIDDKSTVRVNRKMELVTIPKAAGGNAMIGISYLLDNDAQIVKGRIEKLCNNPANDGSFGKPHCMIKTECLSLPKWYIHGMWLK